MGVDKGEYVERYSGSPIDEIPDKYDAEAVKTALEAKPSKRSERVSWDKYDDVDPHREDENPDRYGCENQELALEAGRCACPLANSIRRYGRLRFCCRLPTRRMGLGAWETGSDLCSAHSHLEAKTVPANQVAEWHLTVSLPY